MKLDNPNRLQSQPDQATNNALSGKSTPAFLRRKIAGDYLIRKFGFGTSATLAKAAVTGDGPEYRKVGRMVVYTVDALDNWALAKIGSSRRSTSEREWHGE